MKENEEPKPQVKTQKNLNLLEEDKKIESAKEESEKQTDHSTSMIAKLAPT